MVPSQGYEDKHGTLLLLLLLLLLLFSGPPNFSVYVGPNVKIISEKVTARNEEGSVRGLR
jgi:hypothetical protein